MYTPVHITPVMYTDITGFWFGFDDVITGPIDEIIVIGLLALAVVMGIPGAADALNNLTNVILDTISKIKEKFIEAKNTITILIAITVASVVEKSNNGTYAIQFSDGKYYVGKGSPLRMYLSATREGMIHNSMPISFRFEWAATDKEAFLKEYVWMVDYGYMSNSNTSQLYNRIWSPGRLFYFQENLSLYPGDYWGR